MLVMMGLGPFRFGLDTAAYQTLTRQTEYRWESQERIGRHPAMQFIGEGHTTIDLDGTILPLFRGGLSQIDRMRSIAGTGTPQFLVSGRGKIFGQFVIMSVSETQTIFLPNGVARKLEFAVQLMSYGPDRGF
jgi:phage protein U